MVAAPEPISTALGLCMLGVLVVPTLALRRREEQLRSRLRRSLTEYVRAYRHFGYGFGHRPPAAASAVARHATPAFSLRARPPVPRVAAGPVRAGPQPTVIVHSLDREAASRRRLDSHSGRGSDMPRGRTADPATQVPLYHRLDRSASSKRIGLGGTRAGLVGYWGRHSYHEIRPIERQETNVRLHLASAGVER